MNQPSARSCPASPRIYRDAHFRGSPRALAARRRLAALRRRPVSPLRAARAAADVGAPRPARARPAAVGVPLEGAAGRRHQGGAGGADRGGAELARRRRDARADGGAVAGRAHRLPAEGGVPRQGAARERQEVRPGGADRGGAAGRGGGSAGRRRRGAARRRRRPRGDEPRADGGASEVGARGARPRRRRPQARAPRAAAARDPRGAVGGGGGGGRRRRRALRRGDAARRGAAGGGRDGGGGGGDGVDGWRQRDGRWRQR